MKKIILYTFLLFASGASIAQVADVPENISPLLIGEGLPDVMVVNAQNEKVSLHAILAQKPTILVFYRGGWCPYCNAQLADLGRAEEAILGMGYQIVAISPEGYENIQPAMAMDSIRYRVYADPDGQLLQKTGIAFTTPERAKGYIAAKTKGAVSGILPVPTVMVVSTQGKILFEYINPDYRVRMDKDVLLAVLPHLSKTAAGK